MSSLTIPRQTWEWESAGDSGAAVDERSLDLAQERAWVAAIARGDERALGLLYDRYAKAVFSLAVRVTQDRELAEEITQEVFLRVWRNAGGFAVERGRLVTWLLSIAHHQAIDQLRRRSARPTVVASTDDLAIQALPDLRTDVEEEAWLRIQRDSVTTALGALPEPQRRVIVLAYFRGLTHVEIAGTLNEPMGTVKTRLRLGIERLRRLLRSPRPEPSVS
jgi:RNA polymerase sigma-70 factor (ECF subfamily)